MATSHQRKQAFSSNVVIIPCPTTTSPTMRAMVRADESAEGASKPVHVRNFGEYVILEEVARGGMGVVYKAQQVKLNRIVALKMIRSGVFASDKETKRFQAEAEAAASLNHIGIVPIFEIGQHEGQHYFSMGFVDGPSLADRIEAGVLSTRQAAEIMLKVAKAVDYAHGFANSTNAANRSAISIDRKGGYMMREDNELGCFPPLRSANTHI